KALTLSYDDGTIHDRKMIEIMNHYGIRGTFHLNGGLLNEGGRLTSAEIPALFDGHEVSSHTLTHLPIARCPLHQVSRQILDDRAVLENILQYPVRGISYPYGSYTQEIKQLLPALGIEYARTVDSSHMFTQPVDFLEWKATCHHNENLLEHTQEFIQLLKRPYLYLFYVWGHSHEFEHHNNWSLFINFCEKIGGRDDIWYATNIEYLDYCKALCQLRFSADCSFVFNPTIIDLWISIGNNTIHIPKGKQISINECE
ncbi:MAG: polysaccharide deacetylase family protein, partial [Clostridiales bacterium]|nr:polysaccharide deacetylase family protein [Clostridiales bacterium]